METEDPLPPHEKTAFYTLITVTAVILTVLILLWAANRYSNWDINGSRRVIGYIWWYGLVIINTVLVVYALDKALDNLKSPEYTDGIPTWAARSVSAPVLALVLLNAMPLLLWLGVQLSQIWEGNVPTWAWLEYHLTPPSSFSFIAVIWGVGYVVRALLPLLAYHGLYWLLRHPEIMKKYPGSARPGRQEDPAPPRTDPTV